MLPRLERLQRYVRRAATMPLQVSSYNTSPNGQHSKGFFLKGFIDTVSPTTTYINHAWRDVVWWNSCVIILAVWNTHTHRAIDSATLHCNAWVFPIAFEMFAFSYGGHGGQFPSNQQPGWWKWCLNLLVSKKWHRGALWVYWLHSVLIQYNYLVDSWTRTLNFNRNIQFFCFLLQHASPTKIVLASTGCSNRLDPNSLIVCFWRVAGTKRMVAGESQMSQRLCVEYGKHFGSAFGYSGDD